MVSFPGEPVTLHIIPLDDVGDETYGLVYLVVVEEGRHTDVSCHFIGSCNLIHELIRSLISYSIRASQHKAICFVRINIYNYKLETRSPSADELYRNLTSVCVEPELVPAAILPRHVGCITVLIQYYTDGF